MRNWDEILYRQMVTPPPRINAPMSLPCHFQAPNKNSAISPMMCIFTGSPFFLSDLLDERHEALSVGVNQLWLNLQVAQNWVSSQADLGELLSSHDCPRVSAGTTKHEETSWTAMVEVFSFINKKMANFGKASAG